eukprot:7295894-Alexandrium_andersonii.AAC.1
MLASGPVAPGPRTNATEVRELPAPALPAALRARPAIAPLARPARSVVPLRGPVVLHGTRRSWSRHLNFSWATRAQGRSGCASKALSSPM